MSKLNLFMLNFEFPPIGGGAGYALLAILTQYAKCDNMKVDVLTSAPQPGTFVEKFSGNITIYKVGVHKKNLHFWRKIEVIEWLLKAQFYYRKLLRENDYDLVHAFFGFPTAYLCYRSKKKLPYMISLRGSDVPGRHARLKLDYKILGPLLFKPIWRNAASLVACSEGLRSRALRFLPSVSIDVIPNGIDLDRFSPAENAESSNILRLLTVGRLSVTKRIEILIDAVRILHKEGYGVHFTIAGGGKLKKEFQQIVKNRNLSDIIEIAGRIDSENMPQVYRRHDIFVSASMQEGMSNAMLEAMASGLPIVTTRCEGVEELIKDNGFIVEEARAEEIAEAVRKLADDRQCHRQMSCASRKRATLFSWSSVADQYIECYRKVLTTKNFKS